MVWYLIALGFVCWAIGYAYGDMRGWRSGYEAGYSLRDRMGK